MLNFKISIHSLVKRETVASADRRLANKISIHSLVKRETLSVFSAGAATADFNPLPRKEGDSKSR